MGIHKGIDMKGFVMGYGMSLHVDEMERSLKEETKTKKKKKKK